MITIEDIQKYELYLKYLNKKLGEFFEEQAPYIFCKEGCSHCCEKGEYPMSEIEFAYLNLGSRTLPFETFVQIDKNVEKIKAERLQYSGKEKFMHECPFLINKKCALYNFRAIICRSHGLAFFSKDGKIMVPDCVHRGLNYSTVYDEKTNTITTENFKKTQNTQEPLAHNVRLGFLTSNSLTEELELNFGEIKPLIDWLTQ